MRILFVDPVCPRPYDNVVLDSAPLGGTEATVVRVAHSLAAKGLGVEVTQHNREDFSFGLEFSADEAGDLDEAHSSVTYTRFGHKRKSPPTHVIVLRAPQALRIARKQFPSARLYLWCHDIFGGPGWVDGFQAMVDTQAVPIVVSDWHKHQMYDAMRQLGVSASIPSKRIYNPIDDALQPDGTPVDPNKLVFFSSPHKGLDHTLKIFERFQDFPELADMKLYIANPGYFKDQETEGLRNVVNLGALPHHEVIRHVRSAVAVLHLNSVFPETFGLVHAEANAVGTPFLTSRMGAVPETVDHPAELIDVQDAKAVIDRVRQWARYGRPKVRGAPYFRLSRIATEWFDFLRL